MTSLILQVTARVLIPVMVGLGVYLLLRGHGAPGGGFIGASVVALGVVFSYYAYGLSPVQQVIKLSAASLGGIGLLIAVGTGAAGWLWGDHFFEAATLEFSLPLVGETVLSSGLLFEFGVFVIVVAIAVAVVQELGEDR